MVLTSLGSTSKGVGEAVDGSDDLTINIDGVDVLLREAPAYLDKLEEEKGDIEEINALRWIVQSLGVFVPRLPVEKLTFRGTRALNAIMRSGIHTLGQLLNESPKDLMDIRNFGEESLKDVKDALARLDLQLKPDIPAN